MGGGIALAAPPAPHSAPLYVTCSVTVTGTLAVTPMPYPQRDGYTVKAYVFGKVDSRQHSIYCGPLWAEATVSRTNTGDGGLLQAHLTYDGNGTDAFWNTPNFGPGGTYAVDTAQKSATCAKAVAIFTPQGSTQIQASTPQVCP